MNTELKDLNFFLVLCKTKTKFDKYVKLNKIKKKEIINVYKILEQLKMSYEEAIESNLFKIHLHKKITNAIVKKKDIYYIPHLEQLQTDKKVNKLFNIKKVLEKTHNFNLLFFYEDFVNLTTKTDEVLNQIHEFDLTQILKDY